MAALQVGGGADGHDGKVDVRNVRIHAISSCLKLRVSLTGAAQVVVNVDLLEKT